MENNRQNTSNINWDIGIYVKPSLKPYKQSVCLK